MFIRRCAQVFDLCPGKKIKPRPLLSAVDAPAEGVRPRRLALITALGCSGRSLPRCSLRARAVSPAGFFVMPLDHHSTELFLRIDPHVDRGVGVAVTS